MRITPAHVDHAIVEVVFQLELDRALDQTELDQVQGVWPTFRDELPAVRRLDQATLAGGIPRPAATVPGLEFAAYRRNGSVEWRLQCLGQNLSVNCLAYTRWQRVWEAAFRYFKAVFRAISQHDICAVALQYIDEFILEVSNGKYTWEEMFNLGSDFFPRRFERERIGAVWHLYQGRFTEWPTGSKSLHTQTLGGPLLERAHLDSFKRRLIGSDPDEHVVRIDHFQRLELTEPIPVADDAHLKSLEDAFGYLHNQNKDFLHRILSSSVTKSIGLHASV